MASDTNSKVTAEGPRPAPADVTDAAPASGLLWAVAEATRLLAAEPLLAPGLEAALPILGTAAGVDRVNVYRYDHARAAGSLVAEWCRPGVPALSAVAPDPLPYADYQEMWRPLMAGGVYHSPLAAKSGVKADLLVPIAVGDRFWGTLNFDDCTTERAWAGREVEVLRAAAGVVAAAVRREESEAEKAAAVARATELAAANEALRLRDRLLTAVTEAMKGLLGGDDFEAGVRDVLRRLGEAAGIHRAKVLLQRDRDVPHHELAYEWWAPGLAAQASHGLTGFDDDTIADYLAPLRAGDGLWYHVEQVPAALRGPFEHVGMRSMGVVPIFAAARYVGLVAFDDYADRRVWTRAEMDSLTIAARAIGAAIHRQEMERDKAEAVARERGAATERHLQEVEASNLALRRSTSRLAMGADAREFLGHVLAESLALLGADFGLMLTYHPADDTLRFAVGARPGRTYPAPLPDEAGVFGDPIPVVAVPVFGLLRTRRRPVVFSRDVGKVPPHDRVGRWFVAQGAREALSLLLAVGDEPLGIMELVFRAPRVLRPEELELFEALANQAALALALARLGDRAKAAAVSEERNRLAREIHDTLAQGFTGVILHLQLAQRALPADPDKARGRVGSALDLAREGLQEARRSVLALLPESIVSGDLPTALHRLAEQLGATSADAAVGFALDGEGRRLPLEAEAELLRVAQEALCNALKHAAARVVTVRLAYTPEFVRLSVEDDGRGFDPAAPREHGFGLVSMRDRAARAGGAFAIDAGPGRGTRVSVTVPAPRGPGEGRNDD